MDGEGTYYNLTLEEYQKQVDALGSNEAFIAQVQVAAERLKDHGYAVIEGIVEPGLCERAHTEFWTATERATAGRLSRPHSADDLRDFKFSGNWFPNKHGIIEEAGAAHLPFVYSIRTHPRVAAVFSLLYGTSKRLMVAPDRINYQLPPEWLAPSSASGFRQEWVTEGPDAIGRIPEANWLHVDQSFDKDGLRCIQGLVNLVTADGPGDGTLEVMPGSHLLHDQIEKTLGLDPKRAGRREDWYKFTDEDKLKLDSKLLDFSDFRKVPAGKGALVLWDSRLWHQGGRIRAHPIKLVREIPRPRFVVYVCMQPVMEAGSWDVDKKKRIFREHLTTSHWPLKSKIFGKPRTYGKEPPKFNFSKDVLTAIPGRYPVVDQFSGMAPEDELRFLCLPRGPLLNFVSDTGTPTPKRKRSTSVGDDVDRPEKKVRCDEKA